MIVQVSRFHPNLGIKRVDLEHPTSKITECNTSDTEMLDTNFQALKFSIMSLVGTHNVYVETLDSM